MTTTKKSLRSNGFAAVLVVVLVIGSVQYNLTFTKNVAVPLKGMEEEEEKVPTNKTTRTLLLPNSTSLPDLRGRAKPLLVPTNDDTPKDRQSDDDDDTTKVSTKKQQQRLPFYNLSSERKLIFTRNLMPGFSNQIECFQLAAVLAVQYNRSLVMPHMAYLRAPDHGRSPAMTTDMVFDTTNIRLSYETYDFWDVTAIPTIAWDPIDNQTGLKLQTDPYHNQTNIHFECIWGYAQYSLPESLFPQQRTNFFPFHKTYQNAAQHILKQMRTRLNFAHDDDKDMRVLGMQIRLGDRQTFPVLDCAKAKDFPYLTVTNAFNCIFSGFCGTNEPDKLGFRLLNETTPLNWMTFLRRMADPNCDAATFPVCASDYHAIFVATNNPQEIRDQLRETSVASRLFMMDNVQSDYAVPNDSESVTRLMVEMQVLVAADRLVPSSGSTITDLLLRMRLEGDPTTFRQDDIDTNRTFWETINGRRAPIRIPER